MSWLSGLIVGIVLAVFLVLVLIPLFPQLEETSVDIGERIRLELEVPSLTVNESALGVSGYVFLDIDSGSDTSSGDAGGAAACEALASHDPHYHVPRPGVTEDHGKSIALNCQRERSPNRHLLAELVKELRSRGARLVIIDVVLGDATFLVDDRESNALRAEMKKMGAGEAPVLFVMPTRFGNSGDALDVFPALATADVAPFIPMMLGERIIAAPAWPANEVPLRRYTACYVRNVAADESPESQNLHVIPSIPLLAAMTLRGEVDVRQTCHKYAQEPAPRIYFSLPSVGPYGERPVASAGSVANQVRASRAYLHCPARSFWTSNAKCALPQTYAGKVVAIGASSAERGDRHYTSVGDMAGAEIMLNAARSFLLKPDPQVSGSLQKIVHHLWVLLPSSLVWFALWIGIAFMQSRKKPVPPFWRGTLVFIGFCVALSGVIWLTWNMSFRPQAVDPGLDVLLPVLAVGLELYAEGARSALSFIERVIDRFLPRLGEGG